MAKIPVKSLGGSAATKRKGKTPTNAASIRTRRVTDMDRAVGKAAAPGQVMKAAAKKAGMSTSSYAKSSKGASGFAAGNYGKTQGKGK